MLTLPFWRTVRLKDQKDTSQSELMNGKNTLNRLSKVVPEEPNEAVPRTSMYLKIKFQHNPNTFPMVNNPSFRFSEPFKWNIKEMKSTLKITSAAVDKS